MGICRIGSDLPPRVTGDFDAPFSYDLKRYLRLPERGTASIARQAGLDLSVRQQLSQLVDIGETVLITPLPQGAPKPAA